VLGRTLVRVHEVIEACDIAAQVLEALPEGEIQAKFPRKVPEGEAVGRVEAQRGELIYYIKSNGSEKPERVKIRTPTLSNIPSGVEMVRGGFIADITIAFASIDPCFSCTDRAVVLTEVSDGASRQMTWRDLVELSRRR